MGCRFSCCLSLSRVPATSRRASFTDPRATLFPLSHIPLIPRERICLLRIEGDSLLGMEPIAWFNLGRLGLSDIGGRSSGLRSHHLSLTILAPVVALGIFLLLRPRLAEHFPWSPVLLCMVPLPAGLLHTLLCFCNEVRIGSRTSGSAARCSVIQMVLFSDCRT
jgi:hypothetical protein